MFVSLFKSYFLNLIYSHLVAFVSLRTSRLAGDSKPIEMAWFSQSPLPPVCTVSYCPKRCKLSPRRTEFLNPFKPSITSNFLNHQVGFVPNLNQMSPTFCASSATLKIIGHLHMRCMRCTSLLTGWRWKAQHVCQ